MKTAKRNDIPLMQREGYRVQITDEAGNLIARTRRMTLQDALSVTEEWEAIEGKVSILIPGKNGGAK